jgi:hypothetical protein
MRAQVIDKRDDPLSPLDQMIYSVLSSPKLENEKIKSIHPDCRVYRNSLNLYIGPSGCGKSFTAIRDILKVIAYDPSAHMILVVSKDGDDSDSTFKSFKEWFQIPVIKVREADLIETLQFTLKYKALYNDILEQGVQDQITDTQREQIEHALFIDDFNLPHLQTILFFPDAAHSVLFKSNKATRTEAVQNYFNDYIIRERRHADLGVSIFMCAQKITDLPTDIRSNADTITIFSGFNRHEISVICQYVRTTIDFESLWNIYSRLKIHDKLIFDKYSDEFVIDN